MNLLERVKAWLLRGDLARSVRDSIWHPLANAGGFVWSLSHPAGLFAVVFGPAGLGKGTPIERLTSRALFSRRQRSSPRLTSPWSAKFKDGASNQHVKSNQNEKVLRQAMSQFLGDGLATSLSMQDNMPPPCDAGIFSVVGGRPGWMAEFLAQAGYSREHYFAVLPFCGSPQLLLPLGNRRRTLQGLRIYNPYRVTGRLLKGLIVSWIRTGWLGSRCDKVLIVAKKRLALESLIRDVTGEDQPFFSLWLGAPTRHRKLTIQVMRPSGEIVGYIKLPLTEAAMERVQHEAQVLKRLWNYPSLRSHIPKVLHAGEWGAGHILFQSSGPSGPGSTEFGTLYQEFLRTLWGVHRMEKPGHVLAEEVALRWGEVEPLLNAEWRELGQKALARASDELEGVEIPCGIMHGDFHPGHTRVENGCLFVFDWEIAAWEAPNLWDVFQFHVLTDERKNKKRGLRLCLDRGSGERASFLLYLLHSLCGFFEEKTPFDDPSLTYRKQLLLDALL